MPCRIWGLVDYGNMVKGLARNRHPKPSEKKSGCFRWRLKQHGVAEVSCTRGDL